MGSSEFGYPLQDGDSVSEETTTKKILKLFSPALCRKSVEFVYPFRKYPSKYDEGVEFLDVIRFAMAEFDTIDEYVREMMGELEKDDPSSKLDLNKEVDLNDIAAVEKLLIAFNQAATTRAKLVVGYVPQPASKELLFRITGIAYNRSVDNVCSLNNYKAGSSYVYGEIAIDCFQKILDVVQPTERDVFVDLGSGVGHLVAYLAAASQVKKSYGIEKSQVPATFAIKFAREFKCWISWFGKSTRPFELYYGDFLDEKYRELITKKATIIFINNLVFTPELEERIKNELIKKLKDGTVIITTRTYGRNERITNRSVDDVSSILDVSIVGIYEEACSWTETTLTFYLHRVNRFRLKKFLESKNNESTEKLEKPSKEFQENILPLEQEPNPKKRKASFANLEPKTTEQETHPQQPIVLAPRNVETSRMRCSTRSIVDDYIYFPLKKKLKPRPQ